MLPTKCSKNNKRDLGQNEGLHLGMGYYWATLFHLITHAYSKALLFLGYSPDKSQNMVLMGCSTKHVSITKNTFLLGTLYIHIYIYLKSILFKILVFIYLLDY